LDLRWPVSASPIRWLDPLLELHGLGAFVTITNDNWRDDPAQEAAILATGTPPTNDLKREPQDAILTLICETEVLAHNRIEIRVIHCLVRVEILNRIVMEVPIWRRQDGLHRCFQPAHKIFGIGDNETGVRLGKIVE
jgi:hypothetical protein